MTEPNRTIPQADWLAKAAELFGPDPEGWRFVCPTCGNELSMAEARQQFPEMAGCGWRPEQQCIGRHTKKAGCDWAAYGLFRGPVFVTPTEGDPKPVPVFDFAGKPYTAKPQTAEVMA